MRGAKIDFRRIHYLVINIEIAILVICIACVSMLQLTHSSISNGYIDDFIKKNRELHY